MGSWNGTCGLTQLPIHSGDPVKLVFLKKSSYAEDSFKGGGFCYEDRLFEPLFTPIEGIYNDYGCIENILVKDNVILDYINKESMFKDYDFDTVEEFVHSVERGNHPDISFTLIHKDIFYETINAVSTDMWGYGDNAKTQLEYLDGIIERYLSPQGTDYLSGEDMVTRKLPFLVYINSKVKDIKTPSKEDMVNFLIFNNVLSASRKFWSPQSSAGSQDTDYRIQKLIGTYTLLKEKEYKDEYGEDEEDI